MMFAYSPFWLFAVPLEMQWHFSKAKFIFLGKKRISKTVCGKCLKQKSLDYLLFL